MKRAGSLDSFLGNMSGILSKNIIRAGCEIREKILLNVNIKKVSESHVKFTNKFPT